MKNFSKVMIAVMTIASMLICSKGTVLAANIFWEDCIYVGSTKVDLEVGINFNKAYASVTANENLDASMDGTVTFYSNEDPEYYDGSFSERSYGEVSVTYTEAVYSNSCFFEVYCIDGDGTLTVTVEDSED